MAESRKKRTRPDRVAPLNLTADWTGGNPIEEKRIQVRSRDRNRGKFAAIQGSDRDELRIKKAA
jgi:hypothetical protein